MAWLLIVSPFVAIGLLYAVVVSQKRKHHAAVRAVWERFARERGGRVLKERACHLRLPPSMEFADEGCTVRIEHVEEWSGEGTSFSTRMLVPLERAAAFELRLRQNSLFERLRRGPLLDVELGGRLGKRFRAQSSDVSAARAVLTPDVRRALVAFPARGELALHGKQLAFQWPGLELAPARLEQALAVVVELARALRSA